MLRLSFQRTNKPWQDCPSILETTADHTGTKPVCQAPGASAHSPHHSLLGERTVDSPGFSPIWRNMLSLEDVSWIADYKIRQDVVFPLAGYIAITGEAIRKTTRVDTGYRLRDVEARKALALTDSKATEVVTVLHTHTGGAAESPS